jgi:hypothetical protein
MAQSCYAYAQHDAFLFLCLLRGFAISIPPVFYATVGMCVSMAAMLQQQQYSMHSTLVAA